MTTSPDRTRLIRLVHVAKRELRMDDDAYRAILQSEIGKNSTSNMQVFELKRLVEHFKKCGFKVKTTAKISRKKDIVQDQHDQSLKIRALWLQLATMGIIRDSSEAALVNGSSERQISRHWLGWTAIRHPPALKSSRSGTNGSSAADAVPLPRPGGCMN